MYAALLNLNYFIRYRWTIENDNFNNLRMITPQEEKNIFYTDSLFETTFEKMMLNTAYGVRKLLGDPPHPTKEDLEHTRRYVGVETKMSWCKKKYGTLFQKTDLNLLSRHFFKISFQCRPFLEP